MTAPAPDESLLVHRAQQGDHAAFEQLYRLHAGRIFALCLRLSADRERAETLTQDVFVKAWRVLGSFAGRSSLSTWLHRLTVNVVLDSLRESRRRDARLTSLDDDGPEHGEPVRPASVGERLDLERAIATLPPGARTAFVLHDVEGYRLREIAELSNRAEGTIKAQLFRARKLLQEVLA
jgi:RNA polymerase sigma-70 factor (ECF subfamily)